MVNSTATFSRHQDVWAVAPHAQPSHVHVFVKSLHLLAAAWIGTIALLWIALGPGDMTGAAMIARAFIPALGIEMMALSASYWTKTLGVMPRAYAHEWGHAFSWASVPILFLAATAFLMLA